MSPRRSLTSTALLLATATLAIVTAAPVRAQESRLPEGTPLPPDARVYPAPGDRAAGERMTLVENGLPNVLITGYWPPTNEMVRRFSPNPAQNPDGWIGENWEGRGYNVYAFFPEFPSGLGKGEGDLEVDYQDTSTDFWLITEQINPIALITTGRSVDDNSWEVEVRQRNLPFGAWVDDYEEPNQPTPAPPDESVPAWTIRMSSLPVWDIASWVNYMVPDLNAFVDNSGYCGAFLCEFIAYHGVWYRDLHGDPLDPAWCPSAGHIHVGGYATVESAREAVDVTLRVVMDNLRWVRWFPGDMNCDWQVTFADINPFVLALTDPAAWQLAYPRCFVLNGDCDGDGEFNALDINAFVSLIRNAPFD